MTQKLELILAEYAASHTHPINIRIHWVCVPLIVLSTIGLLASIPFPGGATLALNWATVSLALLLVYYLTLSVRLSLWMALFCGLFIGLVWTWGENRLPISIGIFVISWLFQFVGHEIEKKRPSFIKDLQFLAVGPLWILRKMGL